MLRVRYGAPQNGADEGDDGEQGRAEREIAERRRLIVEAVHDGASQRAVAARFGVGLGTVQRALGRPADADTGVIDWASRPSAPRRTRRTPAAVEQRVAELRAALAAEDLGDHGPAAIHRAMALAGDTAVPSVRTIARIIERTGLLERRRRVRRPAPPPGWYLPRVAAGRAELDALDVIVDLRVLGGEADVLTAVSLHGGDPDAWVGTGVSSALACRALAERWERTGRPDYVQFDNDTRFVGSHANPDALGAVPVFVLEAGVIPVFAPPAELGFQNGIEGFNAYWQRRVWRRTRGLDLPGLAAASERFVRALRAHRAARIDGAPPRRPWPDPQPRARRGTLVFVRRTNDAGEVSVLGRRYPVDALRIRRLVRVELDLDDQVLRAFALSRREPGTQPLLAEVPYRVPERRTWVTRIY